MRFRWRNRRTNCREPRISMAESLSNKVKSEHVGRFESCKQLANPVKGRMEESYRIDSGVRASAFSFFLLVQSVSLLVPHYLLDNLFPFQQSRSLPNPFGSLDTSQAIPWALSSSVSALKYLLNLDEARKSRTRRVCEKGTSKRQLREMPRLFLFIPLLHLSSFSFFLYLAFFHSSHHSFSSCTRAVGYVLYLLHTVHVPPLDCGQNLHASCARSPSGKFRTFQQSTCVRTRSFADDITLYMKN